MLFTTWKCAGGHGPEREELKVMLQQSTATKIPHSYICTLPGPSLPSCEVSSNSCYCRNTWITHPWTSLLGPHARLDWRGTSPGTDAFSSLELLTERTARSFPDRQISLTRKLASIALSALTAWKPSAGGRLHPLFSNLSQRPEHLPCPRLDVLAVSGVTHTQHPAVSARFWTKQPLQRKISQTWCCNRYHTARWTQILLLWLQGLPHLGRVVEVSEFNSQEWLIKAITTWKVSLVLCHCF